MSDVRKTAQLSLFVSLVVLGLKFFAFTQTQSTAILSDALETIANVVTAVVTIIVLRFALAPADEDHPYGHGKLEYFSAAFEGGIILFAAFAILFESIRVLITGHEPKNIMEGLAYILAATLINLFFGLYFRKVGTEKNSEALKASGTHLLADVKTTAGVIFGLLLFKVTGLVWIDPVIGILVGLWLGHESSQIIKRNIGGLLDEVDLKSIKKLAEKINLHRDENIIDIHNLRIIRSGSFHHIDAHLVVPEYLDIKTVHDLIDSFERKVVKDYSFDGEFAFHTDPCHRKYCRSCGVEDCKIRKHLYEKLTEFDEKHLVRGPQPSSDPE